MAGKGFALMDGQHFMNYKTLKYMVANCLESNPEQLSSLSILLCNWQHGDPCEQVLLFE